MKKYFGFGLLLLLLSMMVTSCQNNAEEKTENQLNNIVLSGKMPTITMNNLGDTLSYIAGNEYSQTFLTYLKEFHHIDTAYIADVTNGILQAAQAKTNEQKAKCVGVALQIEYDRLIKANNLRIFGEKNKGNVISESKFLEYFRDLATGGKTKMNRMQAEFYLNKMSHRVVIDSIAVSPQQCDSLALSLAVIHSENFAKSLKEVYGLDDKGMDIVIQILQPATKIDNKNEIATKVGIHTGVLMVYQAVPSYKEDKLFKEYYSFNEGNFYAAFCDAINGKQPLFDEMQSRIIFQYASNNVFEKENAVKFADNKAAGIAFLEENKKKEGVKVTQSGLQYMVLKEGKGDKPLATDNVKVHYHGTLIDGTVFDSSVKRGKPATFRLDNVIKGWTEGVQLMSKGAKYRFFIPQELAYGAQDRGTIQPFSTLIFEVELLDIVK